MQKTRRVFQMIPPMRQVFYICSLMICFVVCFHRFISFADSLSHAPGVMWGQARVSLLPAVCCHDGRAWHHRSRRFTNATPWGAVSPCVSCWVASSAKSAAVMLSENRSASDQPIHHSPLGAQQTHIWLRAPHPLELQSRHINRINFLMTPQGSIFKTCWNNHEVLVG